MSKLSREKIESAFSKFDELGADEFNKRFGFGKPLDYWVLATLGHNLKMYPSKAIAGYAKSRDTPNRIIGGWKLPTCACSLLHNAGYVIVDKEGNRITQRVVERGVDKGKIIKIPEDEKFLIHDTNWYRTVFNNYFIIPGRERGDFGNRTLV